MDDGAGVFPATAMPDPDWWAALWPRPEKVLADLGLSSGIGFAIDLCCGDGLFTAPLARLAQRLDAIDIDPEMLALAITRVEASVGTESCLFLLGDAYDVDTLARQPADVVLMANTFHGVPDKSRLSRAVARALKQDGRFIIVNWRPLPRETTVVLGQPRGPRTELRMSPENVAAIVEQAGFRLSNVVDLPPYHYGTILARRTLVQ